MTHEEFCSQTTVSCCDGACAICKAAFEAALKSVERRKTVRAKRPVRQPQPKICAHFLQFDDCVFFPGDMACGREACSFKPRRLRAVR